MTRLGRTGTALSLLLACLAMATNTLNALPAVSVNEPYKRQVLFGIFKSEDTGMAFDRLGELEKRLTVIGLTDMVWNFHSGKGVSKKYAAFALIAFNVYPEGDPQKPIKELKRPDFYLRYGAEVVYLTDAPIDDVRKQFDVKVNKETLMDGNKKPPFLTKDIIQLDEAWHSRNRLTDTTAENEALLKAAAQAGGTLKADYSATSSDYIWLTSHANTGRTALRWKIYTAIEGDFTVGPAKDHFKVSRSNIREIECE